MFYKKNKIIYLVVLADFIIYIGFATIDPLIFMKVYFSNQHLFIRTQRPLFCFFGNIKTKGQKGSFHLKSIFYLYLYYINLRVFLKALYGNFFLNLFM